jgi:hypothetical protein
VGARSLIHRDEGAQALVEFALVLPLFILIVTGLLDAARAVWQSNTLAYAAREGTRYAIVHGSGGDPQVGPCSMCVNPTASDNNLDQVVNVVRNAAIGVPNITVTVDYPSVPSSNHRLDPVSVEATAPFVPLPSQYMLGGAFQITLRGGSQLVIQR